MSSSSVIRIFFDNSSVPFCGSFNKKNSACSCFSLIYKSAGIRKYLDSITVSFLDFTNQQPLQCGGAVPDPVGFGRNGCCPSQGSQLPRALPFTFSLCWRLNDRRRATHSFFEIGLLFSLLPFYCPTSSPHSFDER